MTCDITRNGKVWVVSTDTDEIIRASKKSAREYALVLKHLYGYDVVIHNEDGTIDLE
jgi:hypothetical protein